MTSPVGSNQRAAGARTGVGPSARKIVNFATEVVGFEQSGRLGAHPECHILSLTASHDRQQDRLSRVSHQDWAQRLDRDGKAAGHLRGEPRTQPVRKVDVHGMVHCIAEVVTRR